MQSNLNFNINIWFYIKIIHKYADRLRQNFNENRQLANVLKKFKTGAMWVISFLSGMYFIAKYVSVAHIYYYFNSKTLIYHLKKI